ncbi:hypothetical protein H9L39_11372 [Fusarium oxysporum f. sp. albedinis]|nr:hypothetical protein H9L39_11372 [Fusarium oxysporum f. sp. albedinis]
MVAYWRPCTELAGHNSKTSLGIEFRLAQIKEHDTRVILNVFILHAESLPCIGAQRDDWIRHGADWVDACGVLDVPQGQGMLH